MKKKSSFPSATWEGVQFVTSDIATFVGHSEANINEDVYFWENERIKKKVILSTS